MSKKDEILNQEKEEIVETAENESNENDAQEEKAVEELAKDTEIIDEVDEQEGHQDPQIDLDLLIKAAEERGYKRAEEELNELFDEAKQLKKDASDLMSEAEKNKANNEKDKNKIEITKATAANIKANADAYNTSKTKDANDYYDMKISNADVYYEERTKKSDTEANNKKTQADTYYKNKIDEVNTRISIVEKNEKAFQDKLNTYNTNNEKLIEREEEVSKGELDVRSKQEEAKFNFQSVLLEERKKYEDKISESKAEMHKAEQNLINTRREVDTEVANYRKEKYKEIDDDIQNAKKTNETTAKRLSDKEHELDIEIQEMKAAKDAYESRLNGLNAEVEKRAKDLYEVTFKDVETFRTLSNQLGVDVAKKNTEIANLKRKLIELKSDDVSLKDQKINQLEGELKALRNSSTNLLEKLKQYNISPADLNEALAKIENFDDLYERHNKACKELNELKIQNSENCTEKLRADAMQRRATEAESNFNNALEELERLKKPTRKERLSSLTSFTKFDDLINLPELRFSDKPESEISWLDNINKKMDEADYKFSKKLLYAFHTSVKIHDWSPLTVLAGVSGTGKSELPRQYAHHGGMNFISVPVKPDWDSMQSLFGYFNSIENKFEPTELCKAIYYMKSSNMQNTMLLVLLDEMNLAYVELYFSDLLSKFETNRGTNDAITYDISLGANEKPEPMEIGDNILWVGTMNEDETTKALSDKVVDRSTLLTFPRPKTLVSRNFKTKIPNQTVRLTFKQWQTWCNNGLTESELNNKIDINKYRKIIEDINEKMSKVNRNLGHRVWQSIERYVFSHPLTVSKVRGGYPQSDVEKQFKSAFAEAVAFKVMPKLRGIEVSGESKKTLDEIKTIIDSDVPELSEDFTQAMSLSSRIFQWCSAKFMDVDEKGSK